MRSSTWFLTLVLLVGFGIGGEAQEAQAGAKMDWSEYLEPPGSRTPARATPTQRPAKATASKKKAPRISKKKGAKAQSKKAKRSARSKRR